MKERDKNALIILLCIILIMFLGIIKGGSLGTNYKETIDILEAEKTIEAIILLVGAFLTGLSVKSSGLRKYILVCLGAVYIFIGTYNITAVTQQGAEFLTGKYREIYRICKDKNITIETQEWYSCIGDLFENSLKMK